MTTKNVNMVKPAGILIAFGLAYVLFFLLPTFNSGKMLMIPPVYSGEGIGSDLRGNMFAYCQELLKGNSPYIAKNNYTPFTNIFFVPFYWLGFPVSYVLISFLTVAGFWGMYLLTDRGTVPALIFGVTFISYGMMFELERGQWNVIAMALTIFGLHYWKKSKLIGGVLLTLAFQLKIWPAIFLLELIRKERQ